MCGALCVSIVVRVEWCVSYCVPCVLCLVAWYALFVVCRAWCIVLSGLLCSLPCVELLCVLLVLYVRCVCAFFVLRCVFVCVVLCCVLFVCVFVL